MDGRQLLRTSTLVCSVCQLQMGWELLLVCPAVVLFSIRCSCRFNLKIWCRLTTQYWWSPRTTVERRDGRRRQVDSSCADGRYQAWSGSWSPSHCKSEGWYYCWAVLNVLGACHRWLTWCRRRSQTFGVVVQSENRSSLRTLFFLYIRWAWYIAGKHI